MCNFSLIFVCIKIEFQFCKVTAHFIDSFVTYVWHPKKKNPLVESQLIEMDLHYILLFKQLVCWESLSLRINEIRINFYT